MESLISAGSARRSVADERPAATSVAPKPAREAGAREPVGRGVERAASGEDAAQRAVNDGAAPAADPREMDEVAVSMQEELAARGSADIEIRYDEDISRFIVRMVDSQSGEVVREIPPERVIELNKRLAEMRGLLVDEKG